MLIDCSFSPLMERVIAGHPFSREESAVIIEDMFEGRMSDVRIGAVLTGMRFGSEYNQREILHGALQSLAKHHAPFTKCPNTELVDCSGIGRFGNIGGPICILSGLVAAAAGAKVAQFGSRSFAGHGSSIEALEDLGITLATSEHDVASDLLRAGISFLYAPSFYPALRHLAAVRRTLGFHTLFDLIFPLANPAPLTGQILGIFDKKLLTLTAETLILQGRKRGLVVYSDSGSSAISVTDATYIMRFTDGVLKEEVWRPEDFGYKTHNPELLNNIPLDECMNIFAPNTSRTPEDMALYDAVCFNASALLWCANIVESITEGNIICKNILQSGKAQHKLQEWRSQKNI